MWKVRPEPGVTLDAHPNVTPRLAWAPLGQARGVTFSFFPPSLQDYQVDSGTLLASPLLKRFTWAESKPKASLKIE